MRFALDWDGTASADPVLFSGFIGLARKLGHEVVICTMRRPDEADGVAEFADKHGMSVIYTSRMAKAPFVAAAGVRVDVWIDDCPAWIFQDG